ncbi:MAG: hypothetical protein JWN89_441 [Parcubacteria group bacterium]|nr:hypothetical protein [Parcubacteria group bacterium]
MSTKIHGSIVRTLYANAHSVGVNVFMDQQYKYGFEFVIRETGERILRTKPFLLSQHVTAWIVNDFLTQVRLGVEKKCAEQGIRPYTHFGVGAFDVLDELAIEGLYFDAVQQLVQGANSTASQPA